MNPLDVLHFEQDHTIFLDAETYYDPASGYILSKMPATEYVRDGRFELVGMGVQVDDEPGEWLEEHEFRAFAAGVDWSKCAVVGHNLGGFDAFILSHHYGVLAGMYIDTLPMARAKHGTTIGNSLKKLMDYYQVGQKGDEVIRAQGKRRKDFTKEEWDRYGVYCLGDVGGTRDLLPKLAEGFPELEYWVVDATVRMMVDPRFVLNEPFLAEYLVYERKRKADLMRSIAGLPATASDEEVAFKVKPVLMSNEKFARLLIALGVVPPRKVSVTKTRLAGEPVMTWAFAKSDPGMQELLEHENEDIRMVAEARVGVKSTINETRTVRMLKMGAGGQTLPVQLNCYAAHTGRWGGAGKMNFQNLGRVLRPPKGEVPTEKHIRSGALRKAMIAPPGHKVIVVDSAAIEARGTAWLAEDASLVAEFAADADVYSRFASTVFGRTITKKDVVERALGKVCVGADTKVLTPRGWVRIVDVTTSDEVWDGVEWVRHLGLVEQGVRDVWTSHSVSATPDHEFLTEHGWEEWSSVLTSPSLFQSVLSRGVLRSSPGKDASDLTENLLAGSPCYGVPADASGLLTGAISLGGGLLGRVLAALSLRLTERGTQHTLECSKTRVTESACSLVCRRVFHDAIIRAIRTIRAMADEVSACFPSGGLTGYRLSNMRSRCPDGTTPSLSLIGRTTTGGMNRETYASSPRRLTRAIADSFVCFSGACADSKKRTRISRERTPTYDLLSAGPRHRFTILSDAGPLIVSNCILGLGYGMGFLKFATVLAAGPMGNDPIIFTMKEAEEIGVDVAKFMRDAKKMARVEDMPSRLPLEERAIHCAVAEHVVNLYRQENSKIVELWETMDGVLEAMMDESENFSFGPGGVFTTERHAIRLPSGRVLRYPGLEEDDGRFSYLGDHRQRVGSWGGALTENVTQAFCRDVVTEQMLLTQAKGYRARLMAHDEVVLVEPDAVAPHALATLVAAMKVAPDWARGLPVGADGGMGISYGSAK